MIYEFRPHADKLKLKALLGSLLLISCLSSSVSAVGLEQHMSVQSPLPPNARFCIVQSIILRKQTFMLDRYTGEVYQMVKSKSGEYSWQKMRVLGLNHSPDLSKNKSPHFLIFLGSMQARDAFLLDTTSGQSWKIFEDSDTKERFWGSVFRDPSIPPN